MEGPSTSTLKRKQDEHSVPKPEREVNVQNENFEEAVRGWLEETDGSDCDDSFEELTPIQSDHDTSSEQSLSEEENDLEMTETSDFDDHIQSSEYPPRSNYYFGRNRYKWAKTSASRSVRTPRHNIIMRFPSTKLTPTEPKDPLSLWNKYFDNNILNHILKWTNAKIECVRQKYSDKTKAELQNLDMVELMAFLGLLIYSAVFKSNHENANFIFATDGSGREIFRCVMSKNRFLMLLNCLRFDDFLTRQERLKDDKLAAISYLFKEIVDNSQKYYNIGTCATVDEQLVPFRGRCAFVVYMPRKPCKYGLKILTLCDAKTSYFYNGYLYTGKNSDGETLCDEEKKLLKPTQSILRLCQPIYGSNRNITADNWFSSIEATDELKKRGLSYVGTLKKNKREIPQQFLPNKSRAVGSSLYGFTRDITLLSHVPKKNKAVLLISSMHHSAEKDQSSEKEEMVSYYNGTKGGVDELDKKCSVYTCSRRTRHWSMCMFYRLLDISTVNAYVLFQNTSEESTIDRGSFLKDLAHCLVLKHMKRRAQNARLPQELRLTVRRVLGSDAPLEAREVDVRPSARKTCRICPASKKRKTSHSCVVCKKPICMQCSSQICQFCRENV